MILLALIAGVSSFSLVYFANWLALIPWRRARDAHWTERARLLWPVRGLALTNLFLVPAIVGLVQRRLPLPDNSDIYVNTTAAALGALIGSYFFDRELFPRYRPLAWARQVFFGWSLRIGVWIVFGIACVAMPAEPDWRMAAVFVGFLAPYLALVLGWSVPLFHWLGALSPAAEAMQRIVDDASMRTGIPVRAVWNWDSLHPLAFALPMRRELILTSGLMEVCNELQVAAICVHELGHLSESKRTLLGRIIGSLSLVPLLFVRPAVHAMGFNAVFFTVLPMYVILRFGKRIARRMEVRADSIATLHQVNEQIYARALETIYRENHLPAVMPDDRQVHPHLYDRMVNAGLEPDFPRPARPAKLTLVGAVYWAALGILIGMELFDHPERLAELLL